MYLKTFVIHSYVHTYAHIHIIRFFRGLGFDIQRDVAIFLCNLAQELTQPKKPPPEWIWECVLILKLHYIEWEMDITKAPSPESLLGLDISGKCQLTNLTLMLMTSWGHSIPLIFQHAVPLLIKLANSGRFTEVIHVVYYIMPILSEYPDTIGRCKLYVYTQYLSYSLIHLRNRISFTFKL